MAGGYYLTYCAKDLSAITADELDSRPKRFGSEDDDVILALEAGQEGVGFPGPDRVPRCTGSCSPRPVQGDLQRGGQPIAAGGTADDYDRDRFEFHNTTLGKKEMGTSSPTDGFGASGFLRGARHDQAARLRLRHQGRDHGLEERYGHPTEQGGHPDAYEERVQRIERDYQRGLITEDERHESIVNVWTEATTRSPRPWKRRCTS